MYNNNFKKINVAREENTNEYINKDVLNDFLKVISQNNQVKKALKEAMVGIGKFNYLSNLIVEHQTKGLCDIDGEKRKRRDKILFRTIRKVLYLNSVSKEMIGEPFVKKVINTYSYDACADLSDALWYALWIRGEELEELAKGLGNE